MCSIIDTRQSTFMGSKNILGGLLIANKVVHEAKSKKKPCFVFKADFEKAYDSVRWGFLAYILFQNGFCAMCIQWIWDCLQSSSISVLVNESLVEEVFPEKGLRLGDPLTPF